MGKLHTHFEALKMFALLAMWLCIGLLGLTALVLVSAGVSHLWGVAPLWAHVCVYVGLPLLVVYALCFAFAHDAETEEARWREPTYHYPELGAKAEEGMQEAARLKEIRLAWENKRLSDELPKNDASKPVA